MPPTKQPIRPRAWIPLDDIRGLKTLINAGWDQVQITEYYRRMGLGVSQATISRRIKEMKNNDMGSLRGTELGAARNKD
jgi:hypothetical protein